MKFPIKLVCKLNHLFPQLNPLYKQCPVGMQNHSPFFVFIQESYCWYICPVKERKSVTLQNLSRATKIPGIIYLMPKEHLHRFLEPIRSWDFYDRHYLLAAYLTYCSLWWVHRPYDLYKHFYVHFVFPDSNPTGNPKSGGTHSLWNEGKLGFFIPFPHHRHIRVIAENCGSDKPDKTFQWTRNVKG